jgi:ethanolamine utilization microcompartment shell protein EutS
MHVLSVEVWVILKVIVLRAKVPRMGKQAIPQEFVPGAESTTIGLRCANPSQELWAIHCLDDLTHRKQLMGP